MKEGIKIIIAIVFLLTVHNLALGGVMVREASFPGLTAWAIENKGVTVYYTNDSCGYLSKNVLQNVSDDAMAGEFNWHHMKDPNFREHILEQECKRLSNEMAIRGSIVALDK